MEFIQINENKIKIMLTGEDLRDFELCAEELDYSNTETKRMFWDVLSRVKHHTGFDTEGHRVLVQLYPSRCGGCEMFVTRLGEMGCDEEGRMRSEDYTRQGEREKKRETACCRSYAFGCLEDLLRACARLASCGMAWESRAYVGEDGQCYLFLSADGETCDFLAEYGRMQNPESTSVYLCEHGRDICPADAVRILGALHG